MAFHIPIILVAAGIRAMEKYISSRSARQAPDVIRYRWIAILPALAERYARENPDMLPLKEFRNVLMQNGSWGQDVWNTIGSKLMEIDAGHPHEIIFVKLA